METKNEQIMQQMMGQQQMMENQLKYEILLSNVFANFMQKHVSSKYFMLSVEYAEQFERFN